MTMAAVGFLAQVGILFYFAAGIAFDVVAS
ncbi:hypothetical protein HDC89_001378 [Herbaspirillum sp. SJZ102]|nr:hypothetical protein [Herbaspirillum sp. SJZ102]